MIQHMLAIWPLVPVFSKTSLNIWKFTVHVLLKPSLENLEHYFTSMWDECNCAVVWAFFGIAFLWDWNENWPFQSYGHCWVFQICWHIEYITFIASSSRIWNSSTGIPSPPLLSDLALNNFKFFIPLHMIFFFNSDFQLFIASIEKHNWFFCISLLYLATQTKLT